MRRKAARPYTLHALAVTGGEATWHDTRSPTWDGKRWNLARLKSDADVLHEVAHWICSPPAARALPNYGLGTDPDGGPFTPPDLDPFIAPGGPEFQRCLARLAREAPDRLIEILEAKAAREEELASVLTIDMMRRAGVAWAARMRHVFGGIESAKFWGLLEELQNRGVDLEDPLRPFERAREATR